MQPSSNAIYYFFLLYIQIGNDPALWKLLFFGFVIKLFLKIILFYKFKLECFLWDKINITIFSGPSNSIT